MPLARPGPAPPGSPLWVRAEEKGEVGLPGPGRAGGRGGGCAGVGSTAGEAGAVQGLERASEPGRRLPPGLGSCSLGGGGEKKRARVDSCDSVPVS